MSPLTLLYTQVTIYGLTLLFSSLDCRHTAAITRVTVQCCLLSTTVHITSNQSYKELQYWYCTKLPHQELRTFRSFVYNTSLLSTFQFLPVNNLSSPETTLSETEKLYNENLCSYRQGVKIKASLRTVSQDTELPLTSEDYFVNIKIPGQSD